VGTLETNFIQITISPRARLNQILSLLECGLICYSLSSSNKLMRTENDSHRVFLWKHVQTFAACVAMEVVI
jgi:hypothetical protein